MRKFLIALTVAFALFFDMEIGEKLEGWHCRVPGAVTLVVDKGGV